MDRRKGLGSVTLMDTRQGDNAMINKIIVLILLLLGAIIAFGSSKIAPIILKRDTDEKDIVIIKSIGFVLVIIAAIITFATK